MAGKRVLLIVNPVSGTLGSKDALFSALKVFCAEGWEVTTALTQFRGHATILAKHAAERGFEAVVCVGGDGTLNETISGIVGAREGILPLGYVPCGSTNDFAATLGISTDPEEAAKTITRSEGVRLDLGRFSEEHYFSYIASFGAFTQASYSAPQDLKNIVGHMAYIIEGIKDISSITPYRVSVEAEGISCSGNYIFGSVSNTRSVGGIVKLKEDEIGLDDGLFEIILVKYPETPVDFSNLITGIFSSDFSSDVFEYFKASEVRFTMPRKLYWSLDGEKVRGETKVEIKNLHRILTLLK